MADRLRSMRVEVIVSVGILLAGGGSRGALAQQIDGQVILYVNAETGNDTCFDGRFPRGNCPTPPPATPVRGPFRTLTRALAYVAGLGQQDFPPAMILVAGRTTPYDVTIGEVFPLQVPPDTLLKYDVAYSTTPATPATIKGPLAGSVVPMRAVVEFMALGGIAYTSQCGIDGTGGTGRGFLVDGGEIGLLAHAEGAAGTAGSRMEIRLDSVEFANGGGTTNSANRLNIHAINRGRVAMTVSNCRFSSKSPLTQAPNLAAYAFGAPVANSPALVHVAANDNPPTGQTSVQVTLTNCTITMEGSATAIARATFGMDVQPWNLVPTTIAIQNLTIDGRTNASVAAPEGIDIGLFLGPDQSSPTLQLLAGTVKDCGEYGVLVSPPLTPPSTPNLTIAGNLFQGNGMRAGGACPAIGFLPCSLPGAGLAIDLAVAGTSVAGLIDSNDFVGNTVGLSIYSGATPGAAGPPALNLFANTIHEQVLGPALPYAGTVTYMGSGIVLSAESAGLLGSGVVLDSNQVFGNAGRGAFIATRNLAPAALAPILRNERIWSNGTAVAGEDGVEIYDGSGSPTGVVQPLFVHCDVWGHPGFGINNVFTTGDPRVWNSNVYGNNGGAGDLNNFGFSSTPLPVGGRVAFSNFCGSPFTQPCGQVQSPPGGTDGCVSTDPFFAAAAAGDFELTCGPTPACPTTAPVTDCTLSEVIDAGWIAGVALPPGLAAPPIPALDALLRARPIRILVGPALVLPDMGALEKQGACP